MDNVTSKTKRTWIGIKLHLIMEYKPFMQILRDIRQTADIGGGRGHETQFAERLRSRAGSHAAALGGTNWDTFGNYPHPIMLPPNETLLRPEGWEVELSGDFLSPLLQSGIRRLSQGVKVWEILFACEKAGLGIVSFLHHLCHQKDLFQLKAVFCYSWN